MNRLAECDLPPPASSWTALRLLKRYVRYRLWSWHLHTMMMMMLMMRHSYYGASLSATHYCTLSTRFCHTHSRGQWPSRMFRGSCNSLPAPGGAFNNSHSLNSLGSWFPVEWFLDFYVSRSHIHNRDDYGSIHTSSDTSNRSMKLCFPY